MKKRLILFSCMTFFFLTGCDTKKETQTTNTNPALYSLKEQEKKLADYAQFYEATYFNSKSKEGGTYVIPGLIQTETLALNEVGKGSLSTSMDPQGVTVAENYVLISAYSHDDKHNSVIYVLDKNSHNYIKTIPLQGKPHVGGLTYDSRSKHIWVCSITDSGEAEIVAISLDKLTSYQLQPDYQPIEYSQRVVLKDIKRASYMTYYNNALYVGYFSEKGEAVLNEYSLDETGTFIEETTNETILRKDDVTAIPDDTDNVGRGIQGVTFYEHYLILSQSYGQKNSKLFFYDLTDTQDDFFKKNAVLTVTAPPYLEQISAVDGKLYTVFESGTERFRKEKDTTKVDRVILLDLETLVNDIKS